ncbi:peptide chain release factor N(5)-glutamine methyltransferase [Pontibacter akesuensis]|uniref:Release factor glutamine methyltransferase n=1 Tax=Pontibacter akesuensis TaxID=388950 RepID=A0A1I7HVI4_9BACT|nr:peptide chain release factor N(5)-glutamine methyltransferase [Pontibacter akesuensis]GHA63757.1 release factor glutamine methyltransferase [Pontibacter akesuensis]SFU64744.1 release factor glutamine methyltransferase [Pontibacter akesuensis]
MATIQELQQHIRTSINQAFPEPEAGSIAQLVLEHVLQKDRLQLRLDKSAEVQPAQQEAVEQMILRLQQQEPVQYVLGTAHFYGLNLLVDDRVLIPRPETEELVDLVLKEHQGQKGLNVLDICTGSGCIPLALQANMPSAKVYGLEVSEGALEVARANAAKYDLPVEWLQADIFAPVPGIAAGSLDIIISNPPYVLEEEKELMRENVLQYEPHLALFVPNADPLKFYRRITDVALELLKKDGRLYFEINERYSQQVRKLLQEAGFAQVRVVEDLFGKARMVTASR